MELINNVKNFKEKDEEVRQRLLQDIHKELESLGEGTQFLFSRITEGEVVCICSLASSESVVLLEVLKHYMLEDAAQSL